MLILAYLLMIVFANLTITRFGAEAAPIVALLLIGPDLSIRDTLHERWHGKQLTLRMGGLILLGSLLSYLLNAQAAQVALASCLAFGAAGAVDTLIYSLLMDRSKLIKINGSNIFSAAADSVIFPAVAFGLPLLLPIMLLQFAAKIAGGFLWFAFFKYWLYPGKLRTLKIIWALLLRGMIRITSALRLERLSFAIEAYSMDFETDESMTHGEYPLLREMWVYWKVGTWEPLYWSTDHSEYEQVIQW